jgi:hypothetical protein
MRNPCLGLLLFAFAASLAACNAAVDPIGVDVVCPDKPLRGPQEWANAQPEAVLDDFEDGDLSLIKVAARTGNWYPFPVSSATAAGEASTKCVARGLRSGHFVATGDGNPGPNWNASMVDPFTAVIPYDASAWSGFSFWIAMGGGTAAEVADMTVGINTPGVLASEGFCTTCGDYHLTTIKLTRSWTRWSIRFDDLKQRGFGDPPIPLLPRDRLVNFIFWPSNPFDIWIDDFRFEP